MTKRPTAPPPTGGDLPITLPVAWLPRRTRARVRAFMALVAAAFNQSRTADSPQHSLEAFAAVLEGRAESDTSTVPARRLRERLEAEGGSLAPARAVIEALRRDVEAENCDTWAEFVELGRLLSDPVSRFLLELHDESHPEAAGAAEALGTAVVLASRVRECKHDWVHRGRLYLPAQFFREASVTPDRLAYATACGQTRAVLDRALDGVDHLLAEAEPLPGFLRTRGLRMAAARVWCETHRLARRLRREDPLDDRVSLSAADRFLCRLRGLVSL